MDKVKKKKLKEIVAAARAGRIVLAEQNHIETFPITVVDDFLKNVFEVEGALLTDESAIFDFVSYRLNPEERAKAKQAACTRIFERYGVRCKPDDYIWEVLERIQQFP